MKKNFFTLLFVLFSLSLSYVSKAAFVTTEPAETSKKQDVVSKPSGAEAIKDAVNEFKNLSKSERKERIKEVKKQIREFKAEKKAGSEPSTNTLLLVILALLLPPLAVYLHEGDTNNKFWISLLLTILFFIPGVIYALIVILGD